MAEGRPGHLPFLAEGRPGHPPTAAPPATCQQRVVDGPPANWPDAAPHQWAATTAVLVPPRCLPMTGHGCGHPGHTGWQSGEPLRKTCPRQGRQGRRKAKRRGEKHIQRATLGTSGVRRGMQRAGEVCASRVGRRQRPDGKPAAAGRMPHTCPNRGDRPLPCRSQLLGAPNQLGSDWGPVLKQRLTPLQIANQVRSRESGVFL